MIEVNSFWHGAALTSLEVLCISSFLKHGITYNLFVYELPDNVPPGVNVKDAGAIVERSRLFTYQAGTFNLGSVAGFSNLFRYTFMYENGGWWTDTDVCYLNGFAQEAAEMYFAEPSSDGAFRVGTAIFSSSPQSEIMRYCLDRFAEKDVTRIVHGETGPSLLTEAILACDRKDAVLESGLVFSVPWWQYDRLLAPDELSFDHCAAVHFWNAMLISNQIDKNGRFPGNSAFEHLKRKYL